MWLPWSSRNRRPRGRLLTRGEAAQFRDEGWLVVDSGLDDDVLDAAIAECRPAFPVAVDADGLPLPTRLQDHWKASPAVRRVATAPRVLEVLRELYDRAPLPFQTLNFPVGTSQLAHSDTIHFNSAPAGFMCGVWVALEDIHPDSGPLFYYPRSHQLPEVTLDTFERNEPFALENADAFVREHYPRYEQFVQRLIAELGLQPQVAILRKGQALVWASNILHGGAPVKNRRLTRHSQVTHYFFEGCRYYTPLLSQEARVFWREPVGITAS